MAYARRPIGPPPAPGSDEAIRHASRLERLELLIEERLRDVTPTVRLFSREDLRSE